jgi:hypothetical protein
MWPYFPTLQVPPDSPATGGAIIGPRTISPVEAILPQLHAWLRVKLA